MIKHNLILLFIILSLGIISANGLAVSSNSFSINKTLGTPKTIELTIMNQESFDFYNVQFESNNHLYFTPVNISSGQNKTVIANITSTENFNGNIRIKGTYNNTATSSKTEKVTFSIDKNDYILDKCSFSIIEGDSVNWINNMGREITLYINNYPYIISSSSSYSNIFNVAGEYYYYARASNYLFNSQTCKITALDTNTYVNNPDYDAILSLSITINYQPTDLIVNFLSTNYSINAGSQSSDIFSIKNTGTNTAKNIHLSSPWIFFTPNDFDLSPGESKNIGFTITPSISNTSQTNQIYEKIITITGNFNTYTKSIFINIPYSVITSGSTTDSKTLEELFLERWSFIQAYCVDNPNTDECTLLKTYNSYFNSSNSTSSDEELLKAMTIFMLKIDEFISYQKEQSLLGDDKLDSVLNVTNQTATDVSSVTSEVSDMSSSIYILALIILGFVVIIGGTFILIKLKRHRLIEDSTTYK